MALPDPKAGSDVQAPAGARTHLPEVPEGLAPLPAPNPSRAVPHPVQTLCPPPGSCARGWPSSTGALRCRLGPAELCMRHGVLTHRRRRCRSSGGAAHRPPRVAGCFVPVATATWGHLLPVSPPTACPACALGEHRAPAEQHPWGTLPAPHPLVWGETLGVAPYNSFWTGDRGPPAHPSHGTQPLGLLGRGPGWGRGGPGRSAAP